MPRVFLPDGNENYATVKREGFSLNLSPAEVDKATYIVGIALSMETLDAVPSHITNTPFVVRFFENDNLALERTDKKDSIPFTFAEGDELIMTLKQARDMAINSRMLSKRPGRR